MNNKDFSYNFLKEGVKEIYDFKNNDRAVELKNYFWNFFFICVLVTPFAELSAAAV